jgi:hypothetical protein
VALKPTDRTPVFACSEEFDVRMSGETYERYCSDADAMARVLKETGAGTMVLSVSRDVLAGKKGALKKIGWIDEFVDMVEPCGVNAIYPCEVKAGNDLFALRERHPEFIFLGWLEKECVNEGNEDSIEPEIASKVPPLLAKGRYFPNGDHGIQPMVTFPNLCRFMTLLHEVTGNPEGEFPRVPPA